VKVFLRADLDAATATEVALLPFVLRHGTAALPSMRAVNRALEGLYGTRLGVDVLKLGEQQVVALRLDALGDAYLPAGEGVLAPAVQLLADLLLDPRRDRGPDALAAEAVAQEQDKLRRFLEGLIDDKATWAAERCVQLLCAGEPYGVSEYGRLDDLEAVDGARLEARRRALVGAAPIDVYLAGSFDAAAAKDVLVRAFAPLAARTGEAPLRGTTPHPPGRLAVGRLSGAQVREVTERSPVKQARLVLGLRTPVRLEDPGYWALLLMNGVLGGFPHSKLFKNVREKAGLCYDAASTHERLKGLLFIACGVAPDDVARARDLCLAQVEAIARGEVGDDELGHTRLAYEQGYRQLLDAPAQLVNLDYIMALGGRSGAPEEASRAVARVTRDEVVAAASTLVLDTVYALAPAELEAPATREATCAT
jgi:predicted Zn-dependent peptidase